MINNTSDRHVRIVVGFLDQPEIAGLSDRAFRLLFEAIDTIAAGQDWRPFSSTLAERIDRVTSSAVNELLQAGLIDNLTGPYVLGDQVRAAII
jgi:hypothetical protein